MRRFVALLTGCLLLFYPAVCALAGEIELLVMDTTAGIALTRQHLAARDRFALHYTHSVEKTLVEEIYEVAGDGSIYLVETTVRSSGYGLPECAPGQNCATIEGQVVFRGLHDKIENLVMRVSYLHDMWLIFNKTAVNLRQVAVGGHRVLIRARPLAHS